MTVVPLIDSISDFSVFAQRAATGMIYVDINGDGSFTPGSDTVVANAEIISGERVVTSDVDGTYIFRNLPSGHTTLLVKTKGGLMSEPFTVEFGSGPETKRRFDLRIGRR